MLRIVTTIAALTAILSVGSWTYRFVEEYSPYQDLAFYVLVPLITWMLFAGPLFLLLNNRKALRVLAAILLVPTSALWFISILVGFYGLRIH